jgi:C4-type Zn-finger protein
MICRRTPTREARCRSCDQLIPAKTPAYFVAKVGNAMTNVFVCDSCVYALISMVASDFDTFDELGEFLTMQKLSN